MIGKTRNPVGVWLLSLVTLGIYFFYWWYKVNDEVKNFDSSIEVNPTMSLLAIFVPICGIVTIVRGGGRIGQAQQNNNGQRECSGGIGFLLAILFGLHTAYYQANLNKLWDSAGQPAPAPAPAA